MGLKAFYANDLSLTILFSVFLQEVGFHYLLGILILVFGSCVCFFTLYWYIRNGFLF